MKTPIKAGAELDILNENELRTVLAEVMSGYLRPKFERSFEQGGVCSAQGVMTLELYRPKPGFVFKLARLVIDPSPAYTFGAPFTNTAGYYNLLVSGEIADGNNMTIGIPAVATASESHAVIVRDGEQLSLYLNGGAGLSGVTIMVRGYGHEMALPPAD